MRRSGPRSATRASRTGHRRCRLREIESVTQDPNDARAAIVTLDEPSFDPNGVEYYFDVNEVDTPDGHDSGWIRTTAYTDVNLAANTQYCYRVKARDMSASLNETVWSDWVCGTTDAGADVNAPTAEPGAVGPERPAEGVLRLRYRQLDYWVEMAAVAATDDSGGAVQYFFECSR